MPSERLNFIRKLKKERPNYEQAKNGDHGRRFTKLGDHCEISSEAIIGTDGFGFEPDDEGIPEKFPHYGLVTIGNNVLVSAGTTIDRGNLTDTRIGDNTKIDHHVHVSHNVQIGRNCIICGGAIIGGSAEIGEGTFIGLGAIIKDHVKIGKNCLIGMGATVLSDVPDGSKIMGIYHKEPPQQIAHDLDEPQTVPTPSDTY